MVSLSSMNTIDIEKLKTEGFTKVKPSKEGYILAFGEKTGHVHKLPEQGVEVYSNSETGQVLVNILEEGVALQHYNINTGAEADHKPIEIPKGYYFSNIQTRYNPLNNTNEHILD